MGRAHLFEWEDQPWFPAIVRSYMVDFLNWMGNLSDKPLHGFAEKFAKALRTTGDQRIIDLCSGSGGPVMGLLRVLEKRENLQMQATLTDLFPQQRNDEADPKTVYLQQPIDARRVPPELRGFRLMCNSFHHMRAEDAMAILKDAVDKNQGIGVLEMVSRSGPALLSIPINTLLLFLITPLIRPRQWKRFLLTYLIPIVPVCVLWDGLVSCLRVYAPDELRALIAQADPEDRFHWDTGRIPIGKTPAFVTYLIGYPKPE